ncbi:PREDICTED: uncharacterized protein LOC108749181 [Trachymyrmex septentrionalis]|uniref:uncharacterized protein LOC108749181 n=1 Tax=Trachymyrmex septentrionalis TaxID=34720 RepID=UPI00084EE106|nr:PREDICTED: uncharacterized protein LOC108749181 [Trachymyrmex septentrionalis]
MQILRSIIFTTLLVSVTAYVLAKEDVNYKTWNKNNEFIEYNGKHKNYTDSNKSRLYRKDTVIRRSHYADPLHLSMDGSTWQLIFLIIISMLIFSYLPIYLKMSTKFWPVFANWSFDILKNYFSFCRPLIAVMTRNSRDNMYQEVYQTYNLPVGFV